MTYCVGVIMDSGLVLASDSRTNAGVDQVGNFRKMTVFERPGDRVIVMLSTGNLSETQGVVALLEQRAQTNQQNIWNSTSMHDVACLVGETLREVQKRDGPYLLQHNIDASARLHCRRADLMVSGTGSSIFTRKAISLKRLRTRPISRMEKSSMGSLSSTD